MKKYIQALLILMTSATMCFAQSQKRAEKNRVHTTTIREYDYDFANPKPIIEEERVFDKRGNLLEVKEYDGDGDMKLWMQYAYDDSDNMTMESKLGTKGKVEEKIIYIYKDGLRREKLYYDGKDRLTKKKVYEYTYQQ